MGFRRPGIEKMLKKSVSEFVHTSKGLTASRNGSHQNVIWVARYSQWRCLKTIQFRGSESRRTHVWRPLCPARYLGKNSLVTPRFEAGPRWTAVQTPACPGKVPLHMSSSASWRCFGLLLLSSAGYFRLILLRG